MPTGGSRRTDEGGELACMRAGGAVCLGAVHVLTFDFNHVMSETCKVIK
jgi:hypothetical protein